VVFYCIALSPFAQKRRILFKMDQLMALEDALKTRLAASRATAANLLSALVAELTFASANGAPHPSPGHRSGKPSAKPFNPLDGSDQARWIGLSALNARTYPTESFQYGFH